MGWPPDVMRRQRLGDLHTVADRMLQRQQERALTREG
jgi:hypothetical protein